MLGRFNLPTVSEDEVHMNCASVRPLDSPDSGLPPSPSSSDPERAGTGPHAEGSRAPEFRPLSYGEGIELDCIPPTEVRYTSSVHYDSDRHFIHCISLQPLGFGLDSCSQTVVALPHNTWRRYQTQLYLGPRQRVQRHQSTTIVYPKHACAMYVTHLHYDCRRQARRFLSSVELEPGANCLWTPSLLALSDTTLHPLN